MNKKNIEIQLRSKLLAHGVYIGQPPRAALSQWNNPKGFIVAYGPKLFESRQIKQDACDEFIKQCLLRVNYFKRRGGYLIVLTGPNNSIITPRRCGCCVVVRFVWISKEVN